MALVYCSCYDNGKLCYYHPFSPQKFILRYCNLHFSYIKLKTRTLTIHTLHDIPSVIHTIFKRFSLFFFLF